MPRLQRPRLSLAQQHELEEATRHVLETADRYDVKMLNALGQYRAVIDKILREQLVELVRLVDEELG